MEDNGSRPRCSAFLAQLAIVTISLGCLGANEDLISCSAGQEVRVGCGCSGLGTCSGDPVLTLCDGNDPSCARPLGQNDDYSGCGLCPFVAVACPPSGRVLARTRGFGTGPYTCDVDWNFGTVTTPTDGGTAGRCSRCLQTCRMFPSTSCCCGSGCICESSCTPSCGDG